MFFFFFQNRYYRANGVRHITEPCENVCALNHYCAITRVDYREFRQCLETAASALASSASPSSIMQLNRRDGAITSTLLNLTIFLSIYNALRCNQRKLLSDWFNFIYHVCGIILAQEIAGPFRRRFYVCALTIGNFMIHCGNTIWQQFNFPMIILSVVGIDNILFLHHHHNLLSWTIIMLILIRLQQKAIFNCIIEYCNVVSRWWCMCMCGRKLFYANKKTNFNCDDGGGGRRNSSNREDKSDKIIIEQIVRNEFSIEMYQLNCIKCQSKFNKLGRSTTTATINVTTLMNCNCSNRICNVEIVQFCDVTKQHVSTLNDKTSNNNNGMKHLFL